MFLHIPMIWERWKMQQDAGKEKKTNEYTKWQVVQTRCTVFRHHRGDYQFQFGRSLIMKFISVLIPRRKYVCLIYRPSWWNSIWRSPLLILIPRIKIHVGTQECAQNPGQNTILFCCFLFTKTWPPKSVGSFVHWKIRGGNEFFKKQWCSTSSSSTFKTSESIYITLGAVLKD